MLPTKFQFIWQNSFSGEDFLKISQSETRIACGSHVCKWIGREMSNLYRGLPIDATYQVSVHLAKQFQEKNFENQPIRNKSRLWQPCLLTNRDEMSNLHRGPSIDASYQVSVHLAKRFQRRRFLKIGQSETRIACGSHVCWWIRTKWSNLIEDLP